MFTWLKKLFTRVEYRVIEVDHPTSLPELTSELKESLRSLQNHYGHMYLIQRLSLQRANLQKYLHEGFDNTPGQDAHLKAGIFWTGWLDSEIRRLTSVPRRVEHSLDTEVHDLFSQVSSDLEILK